VVALRAEQERFATAAAERGSELERLWAEEKALHTALARTYAEIERLNGLIASMEATRAWRVHRWLTRRGR